MLRNHLLLQPGWCAQAVDAIYSRLEEHGRGTSYCMAKLVVCKTLWCLRSAGHEGTLSRACTCCCPIQHPGCHTQCLPEPWPLARRQITIPTHGAILRRPDQQNRAGSAESMPPGSIQGWAVSAGRAGAISSLGSPSRGGWRAVGERLQGLQVPSSGGDERNPAQGPACTALPPRTRAACQLSTRRGSTWGGRGALGKLGVMADTHTGPHAAGLCQDGNRARHAVSSRAGRALGAGCPFQGLAHSHGQVRHCTQPRGAPSVPRERRMVPCAALPSSARSATPAWRRLSSTGLQGVRATPQAGSMLLAGWVGGPA